MKEAREKSDVQHHYENCGDDERGLIQDSMTPGRMQDNRVYMAYAREHGVQDAGEMMRLDRGRYYGLTMVNFIRWTDDKAAEFALARPEFCTEGRIHDYGAWQDWLEGKL